MWSAFNFEELAELLSFYYIHFLKIFSRSLFIVIVVCHSYNFSNLVVYVTAFKLIWIILGGWQAMDVQVDKFGPSVPIGIFLFQDLLLGYV